MVAGRLAPNLRIRCGTRVLLWYNMTLEARDASAHLVRVNPDAFALGFFGWQTRDDGPCKECRGWSVTDRESHEANLVRTKRWVQDYTFPERAGRGIGVGKRTSQSRDRVRCHALKFCSDTLFT